MRLLQAICGFAFLASSSYAHPGGLDSSGGHHDRKHGTYHFHSGHVSSGESSINATPQTPPNSLSQPPSVNYRETARTTARVGFRSSPPLISTEPEVPMKVIVLESKNVMRHFYARVAVVQPEKPGRSAFEHLPSELSTFKQSTIHVYAKDESTPLGLVIQHLHRDPEFRVSNADGSNLPKDPWIDGPFAYREWSDNSGKFSVIATFGGKIGEVIVLHKKDNSEVRVPLERLSKPDQDWVATVGTHTPST